ncbi:MAG TPA: DUF5916 domain-containing protein [Vicinamibacterales bacterium]|nr:DUF5916 domain-containing protein [Vicinamibacterales bacterium]
MSSPVLRVSLFMVLLSGVPAFAQAPPIPPEVVSRDSDGHAILRASRIGAPIQMDGRLDEPIYRDVKPASGFIQQEPHEGSPATDETEVWVFYDDKNIYVGARLHETDSAKRVTSDMRRDSNNLYNNDHIAVMFDTFHDHRNAFGFQANAQGGMFDWQVTNEQPSNNWNGLWEARTANFDGGWTIEFVIPFRSMRFREGSTEWGINVRRMVRWKNELSFLSQVPTSWGRRGISKVSSAGTLIGLQSPTHLRNLDVKPYALGSTTTNNRAIPSLHNHGDFEFGVDAKWGITQSVVTDLTYNTDFAQVEDDEAQVNLTRFSVLFPEKRDFFLEGQDVFSFAGAGANQGGGGQGPQAISGGGGGGGGNNVTPIVFFSRSIGLQNAQVVPILGGGRLIGRGNGFQVGALHMRTDNVKSVAVPSTDFSVLRINKDILKRSRLGVIATRRSPAARGDENFAYGVDTALNPLEELQLNAYWSATSDRRMTPISDASAVSGQDASSVSDGSSYRGQLNWNADKTGLQLEHLFVGEHFSPEIGFLRRSAFRRTFGQGRFSPRPARLKGIRKLYYEASYDYYEDAAGQPESREAQGAYRMELANGDQWALEYSRNFERLDAAFQVTTGVTVPAGRYEFQQTKLLYTSSPQRPLSGTLTLNYGGFYSGTLKEITWRGRVEFGPRFYAEPTISLNYFDTPFGHGDANIISSRLTYTLTPRMFASALLQYQSAAASVSMNARFRWEYQPGSELFVVYSDGRNTLGAGFPALDNRGLVVKLTKLFRF